MTGIVGATGALVLTAGMVADVTGGRLASGSPEAVLTSASIDSRTLVPGALFVALQGTRNGEAFVDHAIARGAAGVLVTRPVDPPPATAAVVVVPDTLAALQTLGHEVRRRSGARVVAVTGSAGKTTTKEIAAHLLDGRYRVYRSHGNLNNHIGLPLSLIDLRSGPDIAVVELGMNHAGEIRRLVELAEPDVRVWTNVGDAHIGYFGSRETIAAAKAEILEWPTPGMVVVANADDALVMQHVAAAKAPVITFGAAAGAAVRTTHIVDHGLDGVEARLETRGGDIDVRLGLPGRIQLTNAAAAAAVAVHFDVPLSDIATRLSSVQPVRRRGGQLALPNGGRLVDDSYNASPDATIAMIEALGRTATSGRRVAVVGEMLELGAQARDRHEDCGRAVAGCAIDLLVVIGGPTADGLAAGAIAGGMPGSRIYRYTSSAEAADAVPSLVEPGDLVLVKGSRGTRTDIVADRLAEQG